jgi:hypothetical protein
MLDAATVVDLVLKHDGEVWVISLTTDRVRTGDSASSLTPPEECDQSGIEMTIT